MPVHDWSLVDDGTFHSFHVSWIAELIRSCNQGILPPEYYAMAEQHALGFAPDILALSGRGWEESESPATSDWTPESNRGGVALAEPRLSPTATIEREQYADKARTLAIRHVSGDRVVALIEIVSRGNKSSQERFEALIHKTAQFLRQGIHLLLIDLHQPTPRDPHGLHAAIWDFIAGGAFRPPEGKPLTQVSYEAAAVTKSYVVPLGIGESLTDMPVFLREGGCVHLPLEETYVAAFDAMPKRWQRVLVT